MPLRPRNLALRPHNAPLRPHIVTLGVPIEPLSVSREALDMPREPMSVPNEPLGVSKEALDAPTTRMYPMEDSSRTRPVWLDSVYDALGRTDAGSLFVVYTLSGDEVRILSVREMTRREQRE